MKYYQVSGKYGRMPIMFYTKAATVADAKINFYLETPGTDIDFVLLINKNTFLEHTDNGQVKYK